MVHSFPTRRSSDRRRRPDTYWYWIILFGGLLGAAAYIVIEMIPDTRLLGDFFKGFQQRSRIGQLEAVILDNPSSGNYQELADLLLDQKKYARARDCYDKAIAARANSQDAFYRRGIDRKSTRLNSSHTIQSRMLSH